MRINNVAELDEAISRLKERNSDLRVMKSHWRNTELHEVKKISKFIEEAGPREFEGERGGFSMINDGWNENGSMFKDEWDDESDSTHHTSPETEGFRESKPKSSLKGRNPKEKIGAKVTFEEGSKHDVGVLKMDSSNESRADKRIVIELSSDSEESESDDVINNMTMKQARLILGAAKQVKNRAQDKKSRAKGKL